MDKRNLREKRIGKKRMTKDGLWEMECVEYKNNANITVRVQVEIDGVIYNVDKKTRWAEFNKGKICFPYFEINEKKYKKCNTCKEILEIDNFRNKQGKCRKCESELNKQWYEEHREEKLEYSSNYREKNKEETIEWIKKWRERNPEKCINYHNNRRNKEENQGKGINSEQWQEMMYFFDWKCAYSDKYIGGDNKNRIRTVDHIIPLSKDGKHEIWNLVPMYANYNFSKNKRIDVLNWYMEQEYFDKERLQRIVEWQIYAYNKWATEEDDELILITDLFENKENKDDNEEIA